MTAGSSPSNPIPIVGVSTRAELDNAEAAQLNNLYGSGNWTITQRVQILDNGVYLERVSVALKSGVAAQVYFDITAVVYTTPSIWDDNDQRPGH